MYSISVFKSAIAVFDVGEIGASEVLIGLHTYNPGIDVTEPAILTLDDIESPLAKEDSGAVPPAFGAIDILHSSIESVTGRIAENSPAGITAVTREMIAVRRERAAFTTQCFLPFASSEYCRFGESSCVQRGSCRRMADFRVAGGQRAREEHPNNSKIGTQETPRTVRVTPCRICQHLLTIYL